MCIRDRAGIGQQLTLVAAHGTHAAHGGTGNDDVAGVQGAVLHQKDVYKRQAEDSRITGKCRDGRTVPLFENGVWVL